MKKITHPLYKDYPEQPYISPERDLEDWASYPEKYPYSKIEKRQMVRLPEGVLPGDIIMLWRIGFGNFTTETHIPNYFEYRYGIESRESIQLLISLGFIYQGTSIDTLELMSAPVVKRILGNHKLKKTGNKNELLERVYDNIIEEELSKEYSERRLIITNSGKELLKKYDDIIQRHGPKM